jgi:predicted molibdopterin-dependent oxidoreductase YjgC
MVKKFENRQLYSSCQHWLKMEVEIDSSGKEVNGLRKKAVELLLSEHRAECEAPCKVVCRPVIIYL